MSGPSSPPFAIARFVLAGLASTILVSMVVFTIARRDARQSAIRDAQEVTGASIIKTLKPVITDKVVDSDPGAMNALDRAVRDHLLNDRLVRIKIWTQQQIIIYSDYQPLIGQHFALDDRQLQALRTGRSTATYGDIDQTEHLSERQYSRLLEINQGIGTPNGTPLLVEAYLRLNSIEATGTQLITSIAPAFVFGIALLFLIQIPLALQLTRQLKAAQLEHVRLLRQVIEAGDAERRRIAADIHDTIVQSLAGTSYSLVAAAETAEHGDASQVSAITTTAAAELRQSLRQLRTLIIAIAPPRLHDEGLQSAMDDLASPLRQQGVNVSIDMPADMTLPEDVEILLYRAAREALRNVLAHAHASNVSITVKRSDGVVSATIRDDGQGFTPEEAERRKEEGHIGLLLLAELVNEEGGSLSVTSAPGSGTVVTLEVQLP